MILVAGGTGTLGTMVVGLLRERGQDVRVLTRERGRAERLGGTAEIAVGDVRDAACLPPALQGVRTVVSAVHGFTGGRGAGPAAVDRDGNRNLIRAAREAGAEHMVLVSVRDAAPDHEMDLMRMKHAAERELKDSGLAWTIVRPSAYMETWFEILGRPLLRTGTTTVFGRGRNPINWVSAIDVAHVVALSVVEPAMRGRTIEVGGPDDLTMTEFVDAVMSEAGAAGRVARVPLTAMRLASVLTRPLAPAVARRIQAGIIMDTRPQTWAGPADGLIPSLPRTSLVEVVRDRAEGAVPRSGGVPR